MTDIIGHLSSAVAIAKGAREICQKYNDSKLLNEIAGLATQLAQVKIEAASLLEENRVLKAEAEERENNPLGYDGSVYRDKDSYPYCSACYDNSGKTKRIHLEKFICPVCGKQFTDKRAQALTEGGHRGTWDPLADNN